MWLIKGSGLQSSFGIFRLLFASVLTLCKIRAVSATACYSDSGIAGIVIATIIATLVSCVIALMVYWLIWKPHKKAKSDEKLKKLEDGDHFAYDNPYFEEDETIKSKAIPRDDSDLCIKNDQPLNINGPEKLKNGNANPMSNVAFIKKSGSKPRSLDDAFISPEPEVISVPLRGHDFTGLGFNITGNMRDGIFVKDVLHRGPASESGQVKTGDRILSVTISFSSMVYEDALTILSYASPYDVSLELKKAGRSNLAGHEKKASMSSNDVMAVGSGNQSSDRLYHPLYRSQSIDDLTQIGKDQLTGGLSMNGGIPPKRSLSIGTPIHRTKRENIQNKEAPSVKPSQSPKQIKSILKTDKSISINDRGSSKNSSTSSKSSVSSKKSTSSSDVIITIAKESEEKQGKSDDGAVVINVENPSDASIIITGKEEEAMMNDQEDSEDKKQRKKAKAPPPPPSTESKDDSSSSSSSSSDEEDPTFADAKDFSNLDDPSLVTAHDGSFELDSLEPNEKSTVDGRETRTSSVSSDSLDEEESEKPKKSSSLGDISKTEEVKNGGSDSLERAASLDFQKEKIQLEGQLAEQNKHLKRKAPNPPSSTSSSSEDTLPSEQKLSDETDDTVNEIYKASVVEVIDADSLENTPMVAESEDNKEPDSLDSQEADVEPTINLTETNVVNPDSSSSESESEELDTKVTEMKPGPDDGATEDMPDEIVEEHQPQVIERKLSTSSSSSSECSEVQEEPLTKVKVTIPPLILKIGDKENDSDDELKTEDMTEASASRRSSTSSDDAEQTRSKHDSSSSEDEQPKERKVSTSSSSSSSDDDKDDVEEPIVKSIKESSVESGYNLPKESNGDEDQEEDNPSSSTSSSESESPTEYSITSTPPASPPSSPKEQKPIYTSTPLVVHGGYDDKSVKTNNEMPSFNIPVIPPIISTPSKSTTQPKGNPSDGEVLEISSQELDDVMMTHDQFMKKLASQSEKQPVDEQDTDVVTTVISESNDSYTVNGITTYTTSYETNIKLDGLPTPSTEPIQSGNFTVTPEEGAISKTVVITNSNNSGEVKIVSSTEMEDDDSVPSLTSVQ